MQVPGPLYAKLEQMRFFGYISDKQYSMIVAAIEDEHCRVKYDVIHGKDGALSITWELKLTRHFDISENP
ncbi:MAG: hypothetical protein BGO69_06690 [Bacteroidetes bacterium 46-16]|nr:MAG: hypothetical protein BGO69_06690 [Bacteroidetes bacterium 46-16]